MGALRATLYLAIAGSALPLASPAQEELPRGQIVDKVECAADSPQSYALYLPSGYARTHPWPILYLFDPSANGKRAVAAFQKAAETLGFIVAGSNNSQNGPVLTSLAAAEAVLNDTHSRLSIDDKRVFLSGFSGGARVACLIGLKLPKLVAGVIGCGAGFPDDQPPSRDTRFAFFGVVGNRDFNYREIKSLDQTLEKLGLPHGTAVFSGPHQWPPEPECLEAIEWMRIHEMSAGIARDDALADAVFQKRFGRAKERETAGEILEAEREYASIARDFGSFRDVSAAADRAADLKKDARFQKLLAAEQKRLTAEQFEQRRIDDVLALSQTNVVPISALLRDLHVNELKKRAESPDRDDANSAERLLASIFGRTSYYFAADALERKEYTRAIYFLTIATEVRPEYPLAWYNRACSWARAGNRKKALEDLHMAVEKGYRDKARMENDSDLASLRGDERFQEILSGLSEPPGAAAKP
jgi:tetratricopeptide (TPR) repeat protein